MSRRWTSALVALALLQAWVLFLYRDTLGAMVSIWSRSDTFAHGFLVFPLVLWLIWRQRAVLRTYVPAPSPTALLLLAAAALLWLLAELGATNSVEQLALVALLVAAVPAVLGYAVFRALLFPLGFLFFSVPIGEFLLPFLMQHTADFTVMALRASGVPVYREGLQFVIPSGNWSVVEACSGVRYLIASLMIGTLFAHLTYHSWQRRWAFVAVSIVVPIVANWFRAYMIVLLGHVSNNKLAVGVDHLVYGWVFFGIVILLMFLIGSRWAEPASAAGQRRNPAASGAGFSGRTPSAVALWASVLAGAALVAVPHFAYSHLSRIEAKEGPRLPPHMAVAGAWQPGAASIGSWRPAFRNPSAQFQENYAKDGQVVGLYIAYYRNQDERRKLVSSLNELVSSEDLYWYQAAVGQRAADLGAQRVGMREAELRALGRGGGAAVPPLTVWRVYWVNGTWTSNDLWAKVLAVLHRLAGRGDESAAVLLYSAGKVDAAAALPALATFAQENGQAIEALLQRLRADR